MMANSGRKVYTGSVAAILALTITAHFSLRAAAQSPTPTSAANVVSVDVGSRTGKPGEQVTVEVTLHTGGLDVVGVQNDISFFPRSTALVGCVVNPDLGKDLSQFGIAFSGLRAIVFGNNVDPISDGAVLYTCTFEVPPGATPGEWPLSVSRVVASSPTGVALPVIGHSGVITVLDVRPTRTPTPTATPAPPSIYLASLRGAAGQQVPLYVRLDPAGAIVGTTENNITFDGANVRVAANADGTPNCVGNAGTNQTETSFGFLPKGCSGAQCTQLHAVVRATSDANPITEAFPYSCTLELAIDAVEGEYPLTISGVVLTGPHGESVPDAVGHDGSVFVLPPTPPAIVLDRVRIDTGNTVRVNATLVTGGALVAGTQNDIAFDSFNAPIVALANGKPDCLVSPAIDKRATSFAFLPSGCSGTACTMVRAIVLSTENSDPIPDGFMLYGCEVRVALGAAAGEYPLRVSGVVLSTPDGQQVSGAIGQDGAVLVGDFVDTRPPHKPVPGESATPPSAATMTPTQAPAAQPSATATVRASRATGGATSPAFSEADGCAIGSARSSRAALALLFPVLGLWVRRWCFRRERTLRGGELTFEGRTQR